MLTTTSASVRPDTPTEPSMVSTEVLPSGPTLTPNEVPRTPATPSGVSTLTGAVLAELFRWAIGFNLPSPLKVLTEAIWLGGIIVEVLAAGVVAAVLPIDNLTRPRLTKMAVSFSPERLDILTAVFSATSTMPVLLSIAKRAVELGPVMISSPGTRSRSPTTACRPLNVTVPRISRISSDRPLAVP